MAESDDRPLLSRSGSSSKQARTATPHTHSPSIQRPSSLGKKSTATKTSGQNAISPPHHPALATKTSRKTTGGAMLPPPNPSIIVPSPRRASMYENHQPFQGIASMPLPSLPQVHNARTMAISARKQTQTQHLSVPHVASQSNRRRTTISHMTPSTPSAIQTPVKSPNLLPPLWQAEDDASEKSSRSYSGNRNDGNLTPGLDSIKRVSIVPFSSAASRERRRNINVQDLPKAYLGPGLKLRIEGEADDSDMEVDPPSPVQRKRGTQLGTKTISQNRPFKKLAREAQINLTRAARKIDGVRRKIVASDDESTDSSTEQSGDDTDPHLGNEEEDPPSEEEEEEEEESPQIPRRTYSPPDLELLPTPPGVVRVLPQSPLPKREELPPPQIPASTPSEELILAIEALSLSTVRMQKTRCLPFLRRNLRTGFQARCRTIGVPTKATQEIISVSVLYRYFLHSSNEHSYETQMMEWVCPLCELHGSLNTREMLAGHLEWDHVEVGVKWEQIAHEGTATVWRLQLIIPEIELEMPSSPGPARLRTYHLGSPSEPEIDDTPDLEPEPPLSFFPRVSLSPPPPKPALYSPPASPSPIPIKHGFQEADSTPSSSRVTSQPAFSRTRSTTATTSTTAHSGSTQPAARPSGLPSRYPTPPPPSDPLGPAAQYPYLPAESEYGGPTIYYSTRPGGPCLYDLLNTLPMEPFGVLAWAILDREEEIYESDDVKDEYKVMHALWARWIMWNRNKFIANYKDGTMAFVDDYWKMIHRAAGWDALRYWLLMLLANRFLTGQEVAKVLKHYESLTGMDFWYD